jgi:hypothetical protein
VCGFESKLPDGKGGTGVPPSADRVIRRDDSRLPEGKGGTGVPPSADRVICGSESKLPEGKGGTGVPPSAQIETVGAVAAFRAVTCVLTVERLEATIVSSSALPAITKNFAACFIRNTSCDVFRKKRFVCSGFR